MAERYWQQLHYRITQQLESRLEEVLFAAGAQSLSTESTTDSLWLEQAPEQPAPWEMLSITVLFAEQTDIERVIVTVREIVPEITARPACVLIEDQDWVKLGRAQSLPVQIAPKLWICPSWCEPPDPEATNLIIDPGLAFGTGAHATTSLCLQALASRSLANVTVLDYGCGSGVLAIAALRLGARCACAVDNDPRALEVSRENAVTNGVGSRLFVSSPRDLPDSVRFDIVIANILAGILLELAPILQQHLTAGGCLLLSGILESQIEMIQRNFSTQIVFASTVEDGWALLYSCSR